MWHSANAPHLLDHRPNGLDLFDTTLVWWLVVRPHPGWANLRAVSKPRGNTETDGNPPIVGALVTMT